jgi:hypothetical protein
VHFTAILDAFSASPASPMIASVVLLVGGGWVLVSSAQRRRD